MLQNVNSKVLFNSTIAHGRRASLLQLPHLRKDADSKIASPATSFEQCLLIGAHLKIIQPVRELCICICESVGKYSDKTLLLARL